MTKMIQLTMVVSRSHNDEFGEDDGLTPAEVTSPVMVAIEKVRSFYPRKAQRDGTPRVGTRITFDNGSGMAVTETFDEVVARVQPN